MKSNRTVLRYTIAMLFEHFTKSSAKPPLMTFQNRKDRGSVDREFGKTILNGEPTGLQPLTPSYFLSQIRTSSVKFAHSQSSDTNGLESSNTHCDAMWLAVLDVTFCCASTL